MKAFGMHKALCHSGRQPSEAVFFFKRKKKVRTDKEPAVILFEKVFTDAVKLDGISEEQARQKGRRALAAYEGMLTCYRITQDKRDIDK